MNATLTPMKSIGGSFTPAGPAGFSPTFAVEDIDGGHRITITDKNGTQIVDVMDGADGFAPTISVEEITGGQRLTVTDKNGTQTVDIMDGLDGGDGFAPTVTVEKIDGGHRLTITDKNGSQTVDVLDGQGAVDSVNGKTGAVELTLADLSDDATHRTVTDEEKAAWGGKSDFSGDYNDLENKPTIPTVPTQVSAFDNDAGYLTQHQDISGKLDTTHATDTEAHPGLFAPADHASQHASGGSDPLTAADIGAATADHTHTADAIGAAAVETGTWTPVFEDGSQCIYSDAAYYKVGNVVDVRADLYMNGASASAITFSGLPYLPAATCLGHFVSAFDYKEPGILADHVLVSYGGMCTLIKTSVSYPNRFVSTSDVGNTNRAYVRLQYRVR